MPPIRVRGLQHAFGLGEARRPALSDIDVDIEAGQLTLLMGPSGSGKTTLLTLMGCLREVQAGSVQLLGHELRGAAASQQDTLRRHLGFIFQAHNLHPALSARQQRQRVAIARALIGNPAIVYADEPTAALDHDSGMAVVQLLKALGRERGTTTVMVTHDHRIRALADRVLLLEDGRLIGDARGG
ncbi:MAG: ATP-binding cassette domain-containing protein [Xanthomonadales bacterium]|nr:ATP-binding cassette domain-containing protein [Xanthomonadales bacterium]